jgi:predicted nucleic acid-binding protein
MTDDSSVVAKWVLPEPDSDAAERLASEVIAAGQRLVVLDLAFAEVANAIWKRAHRELVTEKQAQELLDELLASPVQLEASRRWLTSAMEIATKYDRAIYDVLFVATTRGLKLLGVTADEPLHDAVHTDFPEIVLLRDWQF